MFKKILLTLSLFLIPNATMAQSFPLRPSDGFWNDAFINSLKQKIDTNRIGAANGVAPLDSNGNLFSPIKNTTIDITNQIPSIIACPIGSCPPEESTLGPVYSVMNLQSQTSKLTGEGEMTLNVGMLVDSGNKSGASTYGKLPLYVGVMQTTGAGTAWAFNTNAIRNATPGGSNSINGLPGSGTPGAQGAIGNVATYGYENDLTNWDDDVETSGANIIQYYGHMQGTYRSTAYFNMDASMPDNVYGAKYGMVWQPNSVSDILINDNTSSNTGILFSANNKNANIEVDGSGNVGLYMKGTKSLNDILISNNTPISISVSGTHSSSSINDTSITPAAINLSGTYSLAAINTQSSKSPQVLTMSKGQNICFFGSDYCLSVGNTNNKLSYTVDSNTIFNIDNKGNIESNTLSLSGSLYLGVMTKATILSLSTPNEGQKVFDSDDHTEVTYRCPTTTTCGWFDSNNNDISIITSISNEGLTSSGSTITDSLKLVAVTNTITTSTSGSGVQLPNVSVGSEILILNRSTNSINVYPDSSSNEIESLGAGIAQDLEENSSITFIKTSSTEWRIK